MRTRKYIDQNNLFLFKTSEWEDRWCFISIDPFTEKVINILKQENKWRDMQIDVFRSHRPADTWNGYNPDEMSHLACEMAKRMNNYIEVWVEKTEKTEIKL